MLDLMIESVHLMFFISFYMNRQTVLLLLIVFTFSTYTDTISKQSSSLSSSILTAKVPSALSSEPLIPSNNKPQPFKGPTVETIPTIEPVVLNTTAAELKPVKQISKKQEGPTSLNSTTTIGEEIAKPVTAEVLKINATDSSKKSNQSIKVTDTKANKGQTIVEVLEKSDKQLSNQEKLQRQAIQQKKARQILPQSNTTEMVKAVSEKPLSLNVKANNTTAKMPKNVNSAQKNDDKTDLSESKDKKVADSSIVTTKVAKQDAIEIQKIPQQVIVVNIIDAETNNETAIQENAEQDDQLPVQNKTQTHQETNTKPETVEYTQQSSNEIKIIPLDNEQDQESQQQDEDEVQIKQNPLPKKTEGKAQKAPVTPIIKQEKLQKEEKTATTKKVESIKLQKATVIQQRSIKKQQIKKEPISQTKKETIISQHEKKQRTDEQPIPQKKQVVEVKQVVKDKQQTSQPKEDAKATIPKLKEKETEDKIQAKLPKGEPINPPKAAIEEKPVPQSPKSEVVKPSEKANKPEEPTTNLRRQKQPEKTVLEKDIQEVAHQPEKKEQSKQKTGSIEKQQSPKLKQGSLQQLLEEVKSDLNNDAKIKIIEHLENQIKEQEEQKTTIFEEKPQIQKNQYLQLQSSPRLDATQPDKEKEVSSQEIMDSKTVIVIIILTFIISIPIVREIKSKDSQVKASKDKMENQLKESSQTLGLEFSELDNETGYVGEPLDQEER